MSKNFSTKPSVIVVYTGDGKGKTSASIGLMCRALGSGLRVGYIQFIKYWEVSEHKFIKKIQPLFNEQLTFYKGGRGFYNAGEDSAKGVTTAEHKQAAKTTYQFALHAATSEEYDLVICDEINNAVNDGLLPKADLIKIIQKRAPKTSLCLTGRNFPKDLVDNTDITTDMHKIKHHYDDDFLANKGIDF